MRAPNGQPTKLTEKQWLYTRTKAFKDKFGDWEKLAKLARQKINKHFTNKDYERTNDFRELQERSSRLSEEEVQSYHKGNKWLSDESKRSLGATYARLLSQGGSNVFNFRTVVTGKGNNFRLGEVNPYIFHDIFEINRRYLENGELVDIHEFNDPDTIPYTECKCYITDDGLAGFAITPNGDLISVFSLNPSDKKGFLYSIKDFIREEGATHLDCYLSPNQNLEKIYQKTLGFHTASTMDYNMKYDHDNIAANHSKPKIGFMVAQEVKEKKHFDKDSYDAAQTYQLQHLPQRKVSKSEITPEEYQQLEESVSIETDENGEPLASNLSFYIGKKARENYSNSSLLYIGGVDDTTNNNDLQFFKHGSKEIYSFMTPSREIYLDKTVVSAKRQNRLTLSA